MNIIAIMGPTGVYYKDEPIRELHAALAAMGFQLVYPKNSGDLLKLIEANARICGVIRLGRLQPGAVQRDQRAERIPAAVRLYQYPFHFRRQPA